MKRNVKSDMKRNVKMNMKKILLVLLMALFILGLTGCTKSVATMMTENHNDNSMDLGFSSLEGERSFVMNVPKKVDGVLKYSGKLDSGSIKVCYKNGGRKTDLFTLSGNDSVEGNLDGIKKGKLEIFLETDGKCEEGSFSFEIE